MAEKKDSEKYYSKLIINKILSQSLKLMICFFVVLFTYLIFMDLLADKHWLAIFTPLGLLGMLFLLHPQTEDWEYGHWQGKARQIERHFIE